ncbi:MAG: PAS domain-containing protein [Deltaproteobacteria bacterium]|nr:PAS domain-containing protein [Deltaproteobacteria bacterium]
MVVRLVSQSEKDALPDRILDALDVAVFLWHLPDATQPHTLRLKRTNPKARQLAPVELAGREGMLFVELYPDLDLTYVEKMAEVIRTGEPADLGTMANDRGGPDLWVRLLRLDEEHLISLVIDVTEERARVRKIQDDGVFLDSVIENLPAMVFVKDARDLRFERFNRAGEELLGLDRAALLGRNDYDLFPPAQADFFTQKDREVLTRGEVLDIVEEPISTPTGERWLHTKKIPIRDASGRPKYLLGISMDVTERRAAAESLRQANEALERRVEARTIELSLANAALRQQITDREKAEATLRQRDDQLRQAQKMEAVGRLAGGIAHDFNNLLSVVLSYSALMLEDLGPTGRGREDLEQIQLAGQRAAEWTRQLLAFSRQQRLAPRELSLNEIVAGMEKMIRRLIGEDVELVVSLAPELDPVLVDGGQLEQVLMNLVINARDAMPGGGRLTIETARADFSAGSGRLSPGSPLGPCSMLSVSDTGHGMDEEVKARVFEPFFTTKDIGKGTGLGLSMVHGIVEQSGGTVLVESEPGRGSTFRLFLPRSPGEPKEITADLVMPASVDGETLLLVEDEDQVRILARKILRRLGYRVLEARGAEEALRTAAGAPRVDLLLTDVVMPKTSGRELAAVLKDRFPHLKVLFMSGYTDDAVMRQGALPEGTAFLQKPLTPDGLAKKLREVLDGTAT